MIHVELIVIRAVARTSVNRKGSVYSYIHAPTNFLFLNFQIIPNFRSQISSYLYLQNHEYNHAKKYTVISNSFLNKIQMVKKNLSGKESLCVMNQQSSKFTLSKSLVKSLKSATLTVNRTT